MHNETITRQNRVLAPILLAISILCVLFITRGFYTDYIEKSTRLNALNNALESKTEARDALMKIQAQFASGAKNDMTKRVEQLDKPFVTSDIMATVMLNDFTKSGIASDPNILIRSVSVERGEKLPNGLSLGHVTIDLTGKNMYDVIDYITYLTTNVPYAFTLDTINLPIDTAPTEALNGNSGKLSLTLALGVYYYE